MTYRKAKSKNKFIKATKTITTGGSPGPINNSDILVEENTKVKEIMNIFDFILKNAMSMLLTLCCFKNLYLLPENSVICLFIYFCVGL